MTTRTQDKLEQFFKEVEAAGKPINPVEKQMMRRFAYFEEYEGFVHKTINEKREELGLPPIEHDLGI